MGEEDVIVLCEILADVIPKKDIDPEGTRLLSLCGELPNIMLKRCGALRRRSDVQAVEQRFKTLGECDLLLDCRQGNAVNGVLALNADVTVVVVVTENIDAILLLAASTIALEVGAVPAQFGCGQGDVLELVPGFWWRYHG